MKYLKIYTDFAKDMEMLGEAERGRLFTAMLLYAETGKEMALYGNEKYLWGTAKKNIDYQRDSYEKRCDVNKRNITIRYESLRTATKTYESKQEEEKSKEIYNSTQIENSTPSIPIKPETNSTTVRNESSTPTTVPSRSSVVTQSVKPSRNVIPPTLQMVSDYCESRRNGIDPQAFIDHYTSNGWMVGKTRMKDWQAAVRTWERNNPVKGAGVRKDRFANLKRLYEETED